MLSSSLLLYHLIRVLSLAMHGSWCSTLIATVLMLAIAVSLTVGKQGANYNYFLEIDLLVSLGAGLLLGWLMRHRTNTSAVSYCCALLVTVSFALHATRIEPFLYKAINAIRRPPSGWARSSRPPRDHREGALPAALRGRYRRDPRHRRGQRGRNRGRAHFP